MRILFLGSILLCLSKSLVYSQGFVKGYIVTVQGDTLRGLIKDKEAGPTPSAAIFKKTETGEETTYASDQLNAFYLNDADEMYVSREVDIDLKPIEIGKLELNRQPKFVKQRIFLKIVADGKAKLFFHADVTNKYHFFLQFDDQETKELIYIRYLYNGTNTMATSEAYKEQLKQTLAGCEKSNYSSVSYTERALGKAIQEYNICIGSVKNYAEKKKARSTTFYVIAGIASGQCDYKGESAFESFPPSPGPNVSDISFPKSTSPVFGVGVDIFSAKGTFSVGGELSYRAHSYSGQLKSGSELRTADMAFNMYKFNILATRYFGSKIRPYISAGVSANAVSMTKSNMTLTEYRTINNQIIDTIVEYQGPITQNSSGTATSIGFVGRGGVEYNNILFEVRYDYVPYQLGGATVNLSDVNLLVGYRFRKKTTE